MTIYAPVVEHRLISIHLFCVGQVPGRAPTITAGHTPTHSLFARFLGEQCGEARCGVEKAEEEGVCGGGVEVVGEGAAPGDNMCVLYQVQLWWGGAGSYFWHADPLWGSLGDVAEVEQRLAKLKADLLCELIAVCSKF